MINDSKAISRYGFSEGTMEQLFIYNSNIDQFMFSHHGLIHNMYLCHVNLNKSIRLHRSQIDNLFWQDVHFHGDVTDKLTGVWVEDFTLGHVSYDRQEPDIWKDVIGIEKSKRSVISSTSCAENKPDFSKEVGAAKTKADRLVKEALATLEG